MHVFQRAAEGYGFMVYSHNCNKLVIHFHFE